MVRKFAKLQRIDNARKITKAEDSEFLYHLQNALLLALKEQGRLNTMQYRYAVEQLQRQHHSREKEMRK